MSIEATPPAHPIFVYGTLKRGECRERCWPHRPPRIEPAYTHGSLYELGEYPGLRISDAKAGGELWFVEPAHLAETFRVLDEIEGYRGEPGDAYARRIVPCWLIDDVNAAPIDAYTYTFNDDERLDQLEPLVANDSGIAFWFS